MQTSMNINQQAPSPSNRPPLPQGEGWGEGEKYEYLPPLSPLSLREMTVVCKSVQTSMNINQQTPSPSNRPPLPQGEGWGEGEKLKYLPLLERVGVRVKSSNTHPSQPSRVVDALWRKRGLPFL